jgi:hypothetical protein
MRHAPISELVGHCIEQRTMRVWRPARAAMGPPGRRRPGEINTNDGGRGLYREDPSGHFIEIITRPYGSGG